MPIQVTKITSVQPKYLSKVLGFKDGKITKGTRANLVRGRAEIVTLDSFVEFQRLVLSLKVNQALCYGVPKCSGNSVDLVTREMWEKAGCPATVLPRCNDTFSWPEAGILMLDYDPKGDPLQPEDLDAILKADVPGYGDVNRFIISSSSGHIWKGDEELVSSSGLRVYIPVSNAAEIPILGDRIVKHLWAKGHGFQQISRSGAQLDRTLVDATVWQPSRLDFAAGAICKDGLEQRRGQGTIIRGQHRFLDAEKLPAPTPEEQEQATRNIEKSKLETWPEAQEARFHYIQTEKVKLAGPNATHAQLKRAGEVISMALNNSQLHSEFKVYLQLDGETVCVTVGQLLADPDTYHGAACLDPLEPEYNGGAWVGKVYLDDKPNINSFAHGGKKYWLMKRLKKTEDPKEPQVVQAEWLETWNERFAVVPGSQPWVLEEFREQGRVVDTTFMTIQGFLNWVRQTKDSEGKKIGPQWLDHPKRRQYARGIKFDPSHVGHFGGFYNLYSGIPLKPKQGDCSLFWELLDALCDQDQIKVEYIKKWLAHMVQKPWELPGVCVVLKGSQGIGKGHLASWLESIMQDLYLETAGMDKVTGRFNAHMENKILVYANEVAWSSVRGSCGILKAMITDRDMTVEGKCKDPRIGKNYKRLLMSSNNDWVVPRDLDDRRFFVVSCAAKKLRDYNFFTKASEQRDSGGAEALLDELLNVDIKGWMPWDMPSLLDGVDQKILCMSSTHKWLMHCLSEEVVGMVSYDADCDPWLSRMGRPTSTFSKQKDHLYEHYKNWCREAHDDQDSKTRFWIQVQKIFGKLEARRIAGNGNSRPWAVEWPCLESAIEAFAASMNLTVEQFNSLI